MTPSPSDLGVLAAGAAVGWAAAGREKPQGIRALDVWALGPLMIYVAARQGGTSNLARIALAAAGAATITYNGRNYLRLQGRAEPTSYIGPG